MLFVIVVVSGTVKPVSIFKKGKLVWSERKKTNI